MKKQSNRWMVVAILSIAGLQLSACQRKSEMENYVAPAHVEEIAGSELIRITLSENAMKRLGVKTTPVRMASGQKVVPYASVLYGLHGETMAYTNPKPLVFVRHAISVDYIDGDLAFLTDGPPVGTEVVTTGAAELFGVESGVGGTNVKVKPLLTEKTN